MKLTQHLVITNPEEFFTGNYHSCFTLFNSASSISEWINIGDIEIEIPDDLVDQSHTLALDALEKAEKAAKNELTRIETARQELMCTHLDAV